MVRQLQQYTWCANATMNVLSVIFDGGAILTMLHGKHTKSVGKNEPSLSYKLPTLYVNFNCVYHVEIVVHIQLK